MWVCVNECRCQGGPEEGVGVPGAGVIGSRT